MPPAPQRRRKKDRGGSRAYEGQIIDAGASGDPAAGFRAGMIGDAPIFEPANDGMNPGPLAIIFLHALRTKELNPLRFGECFDVMPENTFGILFVSNKESFEISKFHGGHDGIGCPAIL